VNGSVARKVAIITGAAMGMGEADARLFVKEGAKVVATDINIDILQAVVNEINPGPTDTPLFQAADVPEGGWAPILSQVILLPPYQTHPKFRLMRPCSLPVRNPALLRD